MLLEILEIAETKAEGPLRRGLQQLRPEVERLDEWARTIGERIVAARRACGEEVRPPGRALKAMVAEAERDAQEARAKTVGFLREQPAATVAQWLAHAVETARIGDAALEAGARPEVLALLREGDRHRRALVRRLDALVGPLPAREELLALSKPREGGGALYVSGRDADVALLVDGSALGRARERLDAQCVALGVATLSSFLAVEGEEGPWFPAAQGLEVVDALRSWLGAPRRRFEGRRELLRDLDATREALLHLDEAGSQFRLHLDV